MEKIYYLDNAATTKVFDETTALMKDFNEKFFFNPSASYKQAISSKKELDRAREELSNMIFGREGKLYFTSSATESNNTVFSGAHIRPGQVVLISAGEHPSVYEPAHALEKRGIKVIDIPLLKNGQVDIEKYKKIIQDENVALVSVILVSNETGIINDIKTLSKIAKAKDPKIIIHSDGVQAFGKIKINVMDLGVDLFTISAHKVYAPRGIGALWVKSGVQVDALLLGGGQENGFRSSTENVMGAVMFANSAKMLLNDINKNYEAMAELREQFISKLLASSVGKYVKVNSQEKSSPYILSLSFEKIKGEVLMYALEEDGILISTGSACSSKKAGNRTLQAMGLSTEQIIGSVRLSFSPYEDYDMDYIISCFEKNVQRLEKNVRG